MDTSSSQNTGDIKVLRTLCAPGVEHCSCRRKQKNTCGTSKDSTMATYPEHILSARFFKNPRFGLKAIIKCHKSAEKLFGGKYSFPSGKLISLQLHLLTNRLPDESSIGRQTGWFQQTSLEPKERPVVVRKSRCWDLNSQRDLESLIPPTLHVYARVQRISLHIF